MEGFDFKYSQAKLAEAIDPNNEYTLEDFNIEFTDYQHKVIREDIRINIPFVNKSDNQDPDWETAGSAGFDLRVDGNGGFIKPNEFLLIKTGLYFNLPDNMEMQIRPRSGLAFKHGVTVLNSPGTIDSDYTGEIGVILINHGKKPFFYSKGDRIAQAVISSVITKTIVKLNKVDDLNKETERGDGGFGSTGVK